MRQRDRESLTDLFRRNNNNEVTRFFHPFDLTEQTAAFLLEPSKKDLVFGAFHEDHLIGMSLLRGYDEGFQIPSFGLLIDQAYWKQGIGKKLTQWTIDWADSTNTPSVRLTVEQENKSAIKIYRSLGFEITGTKANSENSLVMRRSSFDLNPPLFVSTSCLPVIPNLASRLLEFEDLGCHHIELSSAIFSEELVDGISNNSTRTLQLHNYFPPLPPKESLCLNLASSNDEIRSRSFDFFASSLSLSHKLGAKTYAIHAGFASDPTHRDAHGFVFPEVTETDFGQAEATFRRELLRLNELARRYQIKLYVENNVCNHSNLHRLLLVTPQQISGFFASLPEQANIGLLFDYGHWKVSAKTMEIPFEKHRDLNDFINAVHIHDNDGKADQHQPISATTPIWEVAKKTGVDFITIEGLHASPLDLQASVFSLRRDLYDKY
jgi:ribosomal-protein-alanine N-acetyltransferase